MPQYNETIKLTEHHFIDRKTCDESSITGPHSVITYYLGLNFPSSYSENKAELSVSSAWRPLHRGGWLMEVYLIIGN